MAENDKIVENVQNPEETPKEKCETMNKIIAGVKEWGRKQIVALKRSPQRIPLACFAIVSVLWLLWLFTFSRSVAQFQSISWTGLSVFLITLLEILILPLFMNAFPKRSKPKTAFIVLVYVFAAVIILLDVLYYSMTYDFIYVQGKIDASALAEAIYVKESLTLSIVHMALMGVSAVVFALLPVYSKLIKKINTSKDVASTEITENIDVEDE